VVVVGLVALVLVGGIKAFRASVARAYARTTTELEAVTAQVGAAPADAGDWRPRGHGPVRVSGALDPRQCPHRHVVEGVCADCGAHL
jgi:hypothetical protein